jgi:hypothetical protein
VRKKLREVRIPYREIVLAEFDWLDRLVLRATRTLFLAEAPTSDKGELTLRTSDVFDEMKDKAAKRFVVSLNQRMAGTSQRSQ